MKNFLLIFSLSCLIFTIGCESEKEVKTFNYTSNSPEAKALMGEFYKNVEERKRYLNEKLMDSILKLDPNFSFALIWNGFDGKGRENFLKGYNSREGITEIEKTIIEAEYEKRINSDQLKQEEVIENLIEKYPDYYQLYNYLAQVKSELLKVKEAVALWEKSVEINPKNFDAIESLAFLHFPTGANATLLPEDERDLDKAADLLNQLQKLYPNSQIPSRFLGNVYRAKNDFEKAEQAYRNSLKIMDETFDLTDENQKNTYGNSLLMMGHINTFQGNYNDAREFYQQSIDVSNKWWKVQVSVLNSHTYLYEKKYNEAILVLSKIQNQIPTFDWDNEIQKNNQLFFVEFSKFLAFGHSLNEEETVKSLNNMSELREINKEILIDRALSEEEKSRIELFVDSNKIEMDIWYNILFGNYEKAGSLLADFEKMSQKALQGNPNAMNTYYSLTAYNSLMEGNPDKTIDFYNKLPQQILDDDNYHRYFYALALKATGKTEDSKALMLKLANDNFATWQNSIVKNLAKAQIKTNI